MAGEALAFLEEKWVKAYPAIRNCGASWEEFPPFLDYELEIRTVLCSTEAIESLDSWYRGGHRQGALPDRAGRTQDALPGHQVEDPKGTGQAR